MKHGGFVTEPVIKELDIDMIANLNIFPYTVLLPNSSQMTRQDGVLAPKVLRLLWPVDVLVYSFSHVCAFKASWYPKIADGAFIMPVLVTQSDSCFQWGHFSDAQEGALFNDAMSKFPLSTPTRDVLLMRQLDSFFSCWPSPFNRPWMGFGEF